MHEVRGFDSLPSGYGFYPLLRVLLLFGAMLLLGPVVVVIFMVTRVGGAQREQRLAAIRLVGATRLQTAVIAAVETGFAAAAGTALAWAAYEVGRRILAATLIFQGGHFWPDDVVVAPWLLALVLAGTPLLVMLTTIVTLRRVQAGRWRSAGSAAGRRRRPGGRCRSPPASAARSRRAAALGPRAAVGSRHLAPPFILLTLVGFVLLGPWLCMLTGRGIARLSRGVPGLIAARRIAADPCATFRAVSGVVLAAFAVTYFGSTIGLRPGPDDGERGLRPGVVQVYTGGVPEDQVAPLLSERAVRSGTARRRLRGVLRRAGPGGDATVLLVGPPRAASASGPDSRPTSDRPVYIPTDGSLAAENRVRTQAANLVPNAIINTDRDRVDTDAFIFNSLARCGACLSCCWWRRAASPPA